MSKFKRKFDFAKNKFAGEAKETTGKITGNEQMELKGKIQSANADFKNEHNVQNKVDEIKEGIAAKINHKIDGRKK